MSRLTKTNRLTWLIALFSILAAVIISYLKNSLELEDAEQAYYSQWWRWGYDDQPPLYTWIQKMTVYLFGVTKFSFSFLRGLLFASVLLLLAKLGRIILKDDKKAHMVLLASVLVPVFIDFAFRRLSHTLLACAIVLATYVVVVRLIHRKSAFNYALLGLCMGIGVLAKYNYALLPISLLLTSFFDGEIKKLVWDKRILLSCVVAVLLFSPHLYWLLGEGYLFEIKESLGTKFGEDKTSIIILGPILKIGKALFEGFLPILLFVGVLFFFRKVQWKIAHELKWLFHLMIFQALVLVVLFVLTDAQEVHGRWLLPLLLPYLVLFVVFLGEAKNNYIKWGTIMYFLVLAFQLTRTPFEKLLGIQSDIHFEFTELHKKLDREFPKQIWMLPNVTYGGQIRILDSNKEIYTLDDFSADLPQNYGDGFCVVNTQKEDGVSIPLDSLVKYGPDSDNLYFFKVQTPLNIPFQKNFQKK